ncbi:MAG: NAD-dependent epimerase/dehydratase family protein, partial [Deltaproteobacteria bacterium]|nr:NAD-dependent epimerase/dehydratase family protein [Deltaproteobacteria bacterium]
PSAAEPARSSVVAVTGASSFLGRGLVARLEEDPRVRRVVALDLEARRPASAKTRWHPLDLTEPAAAERARELLGSEGVDTLVHLAFLSSPAPATAWAHELESVGTMHVLHAARGAGVRKIVLRSLTWLHGAYPTNPNFLTEQHPLRARRAEPFFADKIAAETEALAAGGGPEGRVVTILRTAPILGPTVSSFLTRYLSRRLVPTVLGFDPLWQLLHEADAIAALKLAVDRDAPGTIHVVADGVLPLSTVVKLAGRAAVPLPRRLLGAALSGLWVAQLAEAPSAFVDYLQYLCVADGERARQALGFVPAYTTREAVLDFASAQHLRDAHLVAEARP